MSAPTEARSATDTGSVIVAPGPAGSKAERVVSRDPGAFPPPTGREEDWRFTPLGRLGTLLDPTAPVSQADIEVASAPGVTVERVDPGDPRVGSVLVPADLVSALGLARTERAVVVEVAPGAAPAEPVRVTLSAAAGLAAGHLVLRVGRGATATVVVEHRGPATFGGSIETALDDGSHLTLVCVQDWDRGAVHAGSVAARLGRDSTLREVFVTLGGDLVRLTPTVGFAGPGGDAEVSGVFLTGPGQHHEHRLFVDHEQPHCRSRVTFKGALHGKDAHSVWVGDVLIGPGAVDTDTYESNRNLVLTDGARADSVPNLEIKTGEVTGAGHASATGRFDDEALFYLMSRGITAAAARRLVVRGFFAEVVERIAVTDLRDRLLAAVDAELAELGT